MVRMTCRRSVAAADGRGLTGLRAARGVIISRPKAKDGQKPKVLWNPNTKPTNPMQQSTIRTVFPDGFPDGRSSLLKLLIMAPHSCRPRDINKS